MHGMDTTAPRNVWFKAPARFLADLDPATTGRMIASAADVALFIDNGIVKDVALSSEDLARERYDRAWRDKPWVETVTTESRAKIEDLLRVVPSNETRWRQVNHPSIGGADVPIKYTALKAGSKDRVVALGRDLRSIAQLQQRLVEAHQNLERDYARLREVEARYQMLFHSLPLPILIVDAAGLEIEEANPAAATLLDAARDTLIGALLSDFFSARSQRDVARLVADSATVGQASAENLHLRKGFPCHLAATAFRESAITRVIVRLEPAAPDGRKLADPNRRELLRLLEELPDGLVVAGTDLRIVAANRAFLQMAHLTSVGQMVGARLSDFLGRSPTDLNVLISNLKNHGVVRNFATVLRDRFGNEENAEVSAVASAQDSDAAYGLSVRSVARRLRAAPRLRDGLPSSADQLTGLIGRVPLREIVRESADFIEKLCIEAALEITDDNRASAAEMLGLSRQGLYSKLKRFGLEESR